LRGLGASALLFEARGRAWYEALCQLGQDEPASG
jgi:hypothetical protein